MSMKRVHVQSAIRALFRARRGSSHACRVQQGSFAFGACPRLCPRRLHAVRVPRVSSKTELDKKGDARRVVKASIAMMLTPLSQNLGPAVLAHQACTRVTLARQPVHHVSLVTHSSCLAQACASSVQRACSATRQGSRRALVAKRASFRLRLVHRPATAVHLANISR